jgi:sugar phosphate isomerase/epimerase
MPAANLLSVFVKPWKAMPFPQLGAHLQQLGFTAIELPVRTGFLCQPDSIERDLPDAVAILNDFGVQVLNVAADLPLDDERLYAACARASVAMNRVMFRRRADQSYWEAESAARQHLDAALPLCQRYNVQIGVQNHMGNFVGTNAMGLHHLLAEYDPAYVGIIWDAAHEALEGMDPEPALDVAASHLCMVNVKNGFWQRVSGPEAETAQWKVYWTSARHGRASWPRVVAKIKDMKYNGPICLTAEYSDSTSVDRLIAEDLAFIRLLL